MFARFGWLSTCLLAFSFVAACAEGAPAAPPGEYPADPDLGKPQPECGNGMREEGEQCDCPATVTGMCAAPDGVTCESLGFKGAPPGALVYCAPKPACTLVTDMCGSGNPGGGGMGGGAGRGG